ncbi:hypothetical protein Tco_0767829 [Tanacetum coccineum]
MEIEPLEHTKLEDLGLITCSHDIFLSSGEIPSVDELEPQLLPNFSPLDVNLGDKRGTDPPIKPHSSDSFMMKEVDSLTIHTPPSPYVAPLHLKDIYCYYHPCIVDPKKHYGFKPGLLGQSGSLGVDFLNLEMIDDDWELESKEVSFLGRGLNSPLDSTINFMTLLNYYDDLLRSWLFVLESLKGYGVIAWRMVWERLDEECVNGCVGRMIEMKMR